ncbi:MAG: phosphodiester glycosidase family protein [Acidimicrobiales bacterium]
MLAVLGGPAAAAGAVSPVTPPPVTPPPVTPPPVTPPSWPRVISERVTAAFQVAPGVTFVQTRYHTVKGPERSSVLYVDTRVAGRDFTPALADGYLSSGGEAVSAMAQRIHAFAGTNGDYYNGVGRFPLPLGQGQPTHLLVEHGSVMLGGLPDDCGVLEVSSDGGMTIGRESFWGTVRAGGGQPSPLSAVNVLVGPGPLSQCDTAVRRRGLVLMTDRWSPFPSPMAGRAPIAMLEDAGPSRYVVTTVLRRRHVFPPLAVGHSALVGEGSTRPFVRSLHRGEVVTIHDGVRPDDHLASAVGGGFLLLQGGGVNPEIARSSLPGEAATVVGTNADGTEAVFAVFDGGQRRIGIGVGYAMMAGWLQFQGMADGEFFDNGGSSTMVVRHPGRSTVTVENSPSDGQERLVAECLCFVSPPAGAPH